MGGLSEPLGSESVWVGMRSGPGLDSDLLPAEPFPCLHSGRCYSPSIQMSHTRNAPTLSQVPVRVGWPCFGGTDVWGIHRRIHGPGASGEKGPKGSVELGNGEGEGAGENRKGQSHPISFTYLLAFRLPPFISPLITISLSLPRRGPSAEGLPGQEHPLLLELPD